MNRHGIQTSKLPGRRRLRGALPLGVLLLGVLPGAGPSAAAPDAWREARGVSAMTDLAWYTLTVEGETGAEAPAGSPPPALAVSCFEHENVVALFSPWEVRPSLGEVDKQKVRLRFDDAPPEEQLWFVDDDLHTLMAPDAVEHAMLLRHSERLRIEFTTVEVGRQVIDLDVSGFNPQRGDLSLFCSWPSYIAEAITVTGEPAPSCDLRQPAFSDTAKAVMRHRSFDLVVEARVGEDGFLLEPFVESQRRPTSQLVHVALLRAVRQSRCIGRDPGEVVRLRFRYVAD